MEHAGPGAPSVHDAYRSAYIMAVLDCWSDVANILRALNCELVHYRMAVPSAVWRALDARCSYGLCQAIEAATHDVQRAIFYTDSRR